MARFGDGLGLGPDLGVAAEHATRQALEPLLGRRPDLVCVFVSGADGADADAVLAGVCELSGARHAIGCTAGGVIGGGRGVESASAVSVWAGAWPGGATLRTFHLEVIRTSESLAIVGMPASHADDRLCVLLCDPYSFPADGFVAQSNELPDALPIVGGIASGPGGRGATRLVVDGRVVDRGAVGVVLGGAVAAATIVSQGCRPIGPEMVVTASDGNVLLELAGAPALTKLQEVIASLPPEEQALATHGLHVGIVIDEYAEQHERGDFVVRAVMGADTARRAVVIGDIVEVGRTIRFQVRDSDAADEDLRALLGRVRADPTRGVPDGALLFSCNGRGAALFSSADHDVATFHEALAPVPVAGFFAAGEIGPVAGRNYLHGFTASIVTFGADS